MFGMSQEALPVVETARQTEVAHTVAKAAKPGSVEGIDRRKDLRYPVTGRGYMVTEVSLRTAEARLIDLSTTGIAFHTDAPFPLHTLGRLDFFVLCDDRKFSVTAKIIVRYCVLERSRFRIGAEFIELDRHTLIGLARIVESRSRVAPAH